MISEIILKKIKESTEDENIKELVKELLEIERRHLLIKYPRFSEDYDKIFSKYLMRMKK
jgi:mannitol-1-phosphate/altronate dehydrogenase